MLKIQKTWLIGWLIVWFDMIWFDYYAPVLHWWPRPDLTRLGLCSAKIWGPHTFSDISVQKLAMNSALQLYPILLLLLENALLCDMLWPVVGPLLWPSFGTLSRLCCSAVSLKHDDRTANLLFAIIGGWRDRFSGKIQGRTEQTGEKCDEIWHKTTLRTCFYFCTCKKNQCILFTVKPRFGTLNRL